VEEEKDVLLLHADLVQSELQKEKEKEKDTLPDLLKDLQDWTVQEESEELLKKESIKSEGESEKSQEKLEESSNLKLQEEELWEAIVEELQ